MLKATADAGFYAPGPFKELVEKPKGVISLGAKMGEGWLLTAEMIELVQGGYGNIVCAQPFGCLPNHIVGKGMVNKIRALYPSVQHHPHRLRPQRHQGQPGKPHQADAGRGEGTAQRPRQEPVAAYGGAARRRRAPAEPRDGKRLRKREHQKSKAARRKNRAAFVVSESGDYWKYGCW